MDKAALSMSPGGRRIVSHRSVGRVELPMMHALLQMGNCMHSCSIRGHGVAVLDSGSQPPSPAVASSGERGGLFRQVARVWSGMVWYDMGSAPGADLWVVPHVRDLSLTSSNAFRFGRGVLDRLTEADQSYVFALPRPVLGEFAVEVCQFDLAEDARGILARAANDRVHSGNVGQAPVRCSASRERFLSYIRRVD